MLVSVFRILRLSSCCHGDRKRDPMYCVCKMALHGIVTVCQSLFVVYLQIYGMLSKARLDISFAVPARVNCY